VLGNHFYIGEVKYKNEILPGEQPPIRGRALFESVRQKSLDQWSHRTIDHLLTGSQGWPPGTEFLDVETRRQKSPPKWVNARRDQNPGCEWPEIRAERPYLASYRKRAVCGDWMVAEAVLRNQSPMPGTGNFLKF
jgi:hypothetical protein